MWCDVMRCYGNNDNEIVDEGDDEDENDSEEDEDDDDNQQQADLKLAKSLPTKCMLFAQPHVGQSSKMSLNSSTSYF